MFLNTSADMLSDTTAGNGTEQAVFTSTIVVLRPNAAKSIGLGSYTTSEKMPKFKLSCRPNIGGLLHVTQDRLDIPGTHKYVPMYQLRNLSDRTCRVTIKRH